MVGFAQDNSQKPVDSEWHRKRWEAASETYSLIEWSEQDITRFDLDVGFAEGLPVPTGKDVDENYEWDRPLWPTVNHDPRKGDEQHGPFD